MRKTKIVCTIGPASNNEETLTEMCKNGMNVCRLNFSHGDHKMHKKNIELIKKVREKLPKLKNVTINNLPRLKSLDVSTLKNLSILNIENCTPITSVKFSKKQRPTDIYFESLPNLKKFNAPLHKCIMLRLYNTSISNINFKSAKKLLYLNLVNNKIKNVDLSKSKKINSITLSSQYIKRLTLAKRNKLDSLEWSSSGLKTFKVNNLNKKSLTYLNLRGNKIKTLNVKKFPNLTSIGVDKKVKVIK